MALTITEQMNMIKGTAVGSKPPSNELIDLVHQSAMKYGFDFFANYKVFAEFDASTPPKPINVYASSYVNKMIGIAMQVFNANQQIVNSLKRIIVTIIGTSSITYAQVTAATDASWESTIATNMPRAFELLAGVTKKELTDYNALP